ncbi:MAG: carbohydrate kinase [Saprospiraceae bacterium]|nr:carbohydrate kinase [Saprospiraceae bacterium]
MKDTVETILIFDIGKTNKKYYLFDQNLDILAQDQIIIREVEDDDGDPADNIEEIEEWIKEVIMRTLARPDYRVLGINFSTYGASFVHLNEAGQRTGHLYNYTKHFPYNLFESFSDKYDQDGTRVITSGSPGVGMINSGFQLYWLKYHRPEFYRHIHYSLHFPQYLSYLLTGIPVSDYTSLGCHTALWNYHQHDYEPWVRAEKIDKKLASITSTSHSINCNLHGVPVKVGVGIHDSSAALLPYLSGLHDPFILISTGTWSVSLNPFSEENLNTHDIANGCLYYMQTDGKPVIAQRLFLGYEYEKQVENLAEKYHKKISKIKRIKYSPKKDKKIKKSKTRYFRFKHLGEDESILPNDEFQWGLKKTYHQMMAELVDIQVRALESIIKNTRVKQIIVDGGFVKNDVFLKMLVSRLPGLPVYASKAPAGSALGAAIALMPAWWSQKSLKKNYKLKRIYC